MTVNCSQRRLTGMQFFSFKCFSLCIFRLLVRLSSNLHMALLTWKTWQNGKTQVAGQPFWRQHHTNVPLPLSRMYLWDAGAPSMKKLLMFLECNRNQAHSASFSMEESSGRHIIPLHLLLSPQTGESSSWKVISEKRRWHALHLLEQDSKSTQLWEKSKINLIWAEFRYGFRQNLMLFRLCCIWRIGHKDLSLPSSWTGWLLTGRTSSWWRRRDDSLGWLIKHLRAKLSFHEEKTK